MHGCRPPPGKHTPPVRYLGAEFIAGVFGVGFWERPRPVLTFSRLAVHSEPSRVYDLPVDTMQLLLHMFISIVGHFENSSVTSILALKECRAQPGLIHFCPGESQLFLQWVSKCLLIAENGSGTDVDAGDAGDAAESKEVCSLPSGSFCSHRGEGQWTWKETTHNNKTMSMQRDVGRR